MQDGHPGPAVGLRRRWRLVLTPPRSRWWTVTPCRAVLALALGLIERTHYDRLSTREAAAALVWLEPTRALSNQGRCWR